MRRDHFSTAIGMVSLILALTAPSQAADNVTFPIVRSSTATTAGCISTAKGRVTISPRGAVENMHVEVSGLPPNTGFDLFVIQLANKPFGLSW